MITKQQLIDFENDIEAVYQTGAIKGPIHLRDGNEDILINIFQSIYSEDYVFSTWANHLHALLKGIPQEKVKARILEGESMAMNFPEYNFYTSAIVGGTCPIAVGVAAAIKRNKEERRVYCFIGDMAVNTGIANECIRYSISNFLPVTWIIEDNNKSVDTKTRNDCHIEIDKYIIGLQLTAHDQQFLTTDVILNNRNNARVIHYKYNSRFSHSGVGNFVSF